MKEDIIDILEDEILKLDFEVMERLLWDHSRPTYKGDDGEEHHHHIYWATDNYESKGDGFCFFDEIQITSVTGKNKKLVRPRAAKSKEEQERRTKEKAEVFTPSWVCNAQNNLVDEAWFGRPNVFNTEYIDADGTHDWKPTTDKIVFPEGKTWQDYVWDKRLEMACGEAPYLVSRYDTTTGNSIERLPERIGLLDRKLRVIGENVTTSADWIYWAKCAVKSTYGFEWQGDNLLLAREAILYTVIDYYTAFTTEVLKKKSKLTIATLRTLAYIISWNIFQMDGITYTLPMSGERETEVNESLQGDLFGGLCVVEVKHAIQAQKVKAQVAEWQKDGEANRIIHNFDKLLN